MDANKPVISDEEGHNLKQQLDEARHELAEQYELNQSLNEELAAFREEMSASNEELSATNEELAATNEELTVANEDLHHSRQALDALNRTLEKRIAERTRDLLESEQRLSSVVESAPFPIGVYVGREMRILLANQNIMDVWGKGNDVVGKLYSEVLPELQNQEIFEQLDGVYTTGIPYHARNQRVDIVINKRLETFYFNYSFTPLFDAKGNVYGVMNTAADVTDLNLAKQKVERNEENLRNMILQAPVAMCILLGPQHVIAVANQLMIELWGKPESDVINKPVFEALPDARSQGLEELMANVYFKGESFKADERPVSLLRNGQYEDVYQNFVYEPYKDAEGNILGIIAITLDVTEQVMSRRAIADAEERSRLAVEAAEIGTYEHDLVTDELRASDRYFEIFGYRHPVPRSELLQLIHPEDREMVDLRRAEGYVNGNLFYEARIVRPDGTLCWLRAQGKMYYDEGRRPLKLLGTVLDITEFKRLQQQKDDFISIASHELKTPITSLKASLQLLERLKNKPVTSMLPKLIEQSSRSMSKISELVEDLLNVSRMSEGKLRLNMITFNIADMLNNCCSDIRLHGRHELIFEGDNTLTIYADEHRIAQVVVNFVNNAVKYAPDSKQIYLIAEKREGHVWIAVRDSGMGVSAEKLPHLFDRYYRADESGFQVSGLGLGLYISAEIIRRHEGEIGVFSERGKGSTFWFTLPDLSN